MDALNTQQFGADLPPGQKEEDEEGEGGGKEGTVAQTGCNLQRLKREKRVQ